MGEMHDQVSAFAKRFLADESGATAIEYGLLVSMLGFVIVAAVGALGDKLYGMLNTLTDHLSVAID